MIYGYQFGMEKSVSNGIYHGHMHIRRLRWITDERRLTELKVEQALAHMDYSTDFVIRFQTSINSKSKWTWYAPEMRHSMNEVSCRLAALILRRLKKHSIELDSADLPAKIVEVMAAVPVRYHCGEWVFDERQFPELNQFDPMLFAKRRLE